MKAAERVAAALKLSYADDAGIRTLVAEIEDEVERLLASLLCRPGP